MAGRISFLNNRMRRLEGMSKRKRSHQTQNGFTIPELVVVVSVLGILSAIVMPNYTEYVQQSRRIDATQTLADFATKQEVFFSKAEEYTTDLTTSAGLNLGSDLSPSQYYSISADACDGGTIETCYKLTATARVSEAQKYDTQCQVFTLDSRGVKTAIGDSVDTTSICW